MSGLRLVIPELFEIRILEFGTDHHGNPTVAIGIRQMIDGQGRERQVVLTEGSRVKLDLDHQSGPGGEGPAMRVD